MFHKVILVNSSLTFSNTSAVTFSDNVAVFGGALNFYCYHFILFKGDGNCTIMFNSNKATQNGGAIYISTKTFRCYILRKSYSYVS